MVPSNLRTDQVESALREFKVDAEQVLKLGGWRTSSDDTAIARVAYDHGLLTLSLGQVESALNELGIEAEQLFELTDWRTTSDDVAVAHVPFPDGN